MTARNAKLPEDDARLVARSKELIAALDELHRAGQELAGEHRVIAEEQKTS